MASPHFPVRESWLSLYQETPLMPQQVIFDAHHHLWDRPEGRYLVGDLLTDVQEGHDVRASLYVQCRTGYLTDGPASLQSVGEVQTIRRWGQATPRYPIGMVAFADLQLGHRVEPVLEALIDAGAGLVRGIRNSTAYHPNPVFQSNPVPAPAGLLSTDQFKTGARQVANAGLTLDVWAYHTQLDEVYRLAHAVPGLKVVIDHCGGPLGLGPFALDLGKTFHEWQAAMKRLAALPNTFVKLGGFGLAVMGHRYADADKPPSSMTLSENWKPYIQTCIDLFGTDRAMFESNFPVDKGQFSYGVMWNAFKRIAWDFSQQEQDNLFWRTAARVYQVDDSVFLKLKEEVV